MKQLTSLLAAAVLGIGVAACGSDDSATTDESSSGTVSGTVVLGDASALADADAVLTVQLVDISLADAAATVLDSEEIDVDGTSFPVGFDLEFEPDEIVDTNTYAIEARVDAGDTLLAINDTVFPVITGGAATTGVDVELVVVAPSGGEATDEAATDEEATDDTATDGETTDDTAASAIVWPGVEPNLADAPAEVTAEWEALFQQVLDESPGLNGVWVAMSDPDLGTWITALGEATLGGPAATVDDHSRMGSITKTFTATAVLQQVEAGTLALDDTVADVLPDIAEQFPPTAELTVEQLLSMTSGLPDYANVPGAATAQVPDDPSRVWTPTDLIAAALSAADPEPPGTPGYSTTNYAILGLMLEAVTGSPAEEIVTDVAVQAGLTETALLPGDQNEMPEPSVSGYMDEAGVELMAELGAEIEVDLDVTDWSVSWGGPGGGAYTTVTDLHAWAASGSGTALLGDEMAARRFEMFETNEVPGVGPYGLGLIEVAPGWIGHSGQLLGYEAFAAYEPATGATFAALVNSTTGNVGIDLAWRSLFGLPIG